MPSDAALRVKCDQILGIDVEKLGRRAQLQDPVLPVPAQKIRIFDPACIHAHQLQRQHLALFGPRRTQCRDVENRVELAAWIEQRRRGASQRDMGGIEMIGLMDRQRLPGRKRGADSAGAGAVLAPFRAQVEASPAQRGIRAGIAEVVDGHAVSVRQQHHIAEPRHLAIQRFQAVARNPREIVDALLVLPQPRAREDPRLLHAGRIEAVLVHAAPPGAPDDRIVHPCGCRQPAAGRQDYGFDVFALPHIHRRLLSPQRLAWGTAVSARRPGRACGHASTSAVGSLM